MEACCAGGVDVESTDRCKTNSWQRAGPPKFLLLQDGLGNYAVLKSRVPVRSTPITTVTVLWPWVANPPSHPSPCTRGTKGPGRGSFENIKEVDLGWGPSGDDE